jgi:hypothetical protein
MLVRIGICGCIITSDKEPCTYGENSRYTGHIWYVPHKNFLLHQKYLLFKRKYLAMILHGGDFPAYSQCAE